MIETIVEFFKNLDNNVIIIGVSVIILWIFVKAIRWILKIAIFILLIAVIAWKVPAVHQLLVSLMN